MPGAAVSFALAGGGSLATSALNVDDAGTFTTTFQPPSSGSGTAVITASATVEGQPLSVNIPVTWTTVTPKIAFECSTPPANPQLCVVNPDGTGFTQLTNTVTSNLYPAWSPDHTRLAFNCGGPICTMNADGTGLKQLTASNFSDGPAWSPDGLRLAVTENATPASIAIFSAADGSGLTHVPTTLCGIQFPVWSPDGARFAFGAQELKTGASCIAPGATVTNDVFTMNIDGTGVTRLHSGGGVPHWSHNGAAITYTSINLGATWVFTMDANGANQVPTVAGDFGSWSPDDTQLVYFDYVTRPYTLKLVAATGGSPTLLWSGTASASDPAW
jgi:TolB protein